MTDRPAIKPLEWKFLATPPSGEEYASTPLGTYFIQLDCKRFPVKLHSWQLGTFATVEAAKVAAQQDFASRIRSCLLDKPEAVEETGDLRDQRNSLIARGIDPNLDTVPTTTDTDAAQSEIDRLRRELEEARKALEAAEPYVELCHSEIIA